MHWRQDAANQIAVTLRQRQATLPVAMAGWREAPACIVKHYYLKAVTDVSDVDYNGEEIIELGRWRAGARHRPVLSSIITLRQ